MTYVINPQVTIASVDYTAETINGVTITQGRTTVDEQPRAGYCTVNIVDFDNNVANIEIDEQIVIKVDDSNGNEVTLFTGFVADVQKQVDARGTVGTQTSTRVTGIGSLAKLNRRRVGASGFPKQLDGERIAEILFETAGKRWNTLDPALTWQDVNPLQNWANFDVLIGKIDEGDFELFAYNQGIANGLGLAQIMAQSGLGILYEGTDGRINYDEFSARAGKVSVDGFLNLDLDAMLAVGLTSISRLSDLINDVEIIYKNGQSETGIEANSNALYGEFDFNLTTQLELQSDAEQRVEYYLETRAFPRVSLSQLNLTLGTNIDNTLRNDLLGIGISTPIAINGLPLNVYPEGFTGFVEGYTWTIARNELFLSLNVSDYALSQIQMNWLQVPAALRWQDVTATLEWENARSVN
jgi:hypothetical protein